MRVYNDHILHQSGLVLLACFQMQYWQIKWSQNTLIQNLLSLMKVMTEFVSISSDNGIDHNDQDDAEDRKVLAMIIQKKKKKKKE